MLFPEQTAGLLSRCTFPPSGTSLACAVSGGADSLSMLALGVASGCSVTAYHVDHQIRPGSAKEAEVVEHAAGRIGAAFVSLTVECPPGPNLEARARALRFSVLPREIATGHTADDQAETMLLNLLRGSGRDGLSGMQRGWRHPILSLRRSETAAFAAALGVEIVDDRSNVDPRYRRNRVRHELLPLLDDIAGRDIVPVLVRQSDHLRDESALLDELASHLDPTDVKVLRAAPVALSRRALRRWLRDESTGGYMPDAGVIERVMRVVAGEVTACEIVGGRRVRRSRGRLAVEEATSVE